MYRWIDNRLVFASKVGTPLDASHCAAGLPVGDHECGGRRPGRVDAARAAHSFVSLLSDSGVPLEEISRLVGHSSTAVTELVYRQQIRPVLQAGATVMDQLFAAGEGIASDA